MSESNRIEYKRELTDALEKEAIAFLNYHDGGILYIGIDKDGNAVGVKDADALQLAIKDRIKNNIQPSALGLFDVILEQRDSKPVIKIILASGSEKLHYLRKYGISEKGCFMRLGSACEPMPQGVIEELFAANLELLTEDDAYNYAAYLLADDNGNSTQVAKYAGTDRVELIESKEYGYCCLVKTCKAVLDRLEGIENRVLTTITPRERINRPLWNPVALREAVINAIIHNDYTTELVPKFEIFSDRLEITSAGVVHTGREQEDFFVGYSMPRNKTLMRVFKDLDMVEYLGSGMPRILKDYPRELFNFSSHFIRLSMPMEEEARATEQVAEQVTEQVAEQVLRVARCLAEGPLSSGEIQLAIGLKHRPTLQISYLRPALAAGIIEMTVPDKPNSRLQQYRLTEKGRGVLQQQNRGR